jgi:predicted nuclease with TOPRIM domain
MTEAEAKEKSMAVTMSELEMKTAHLEQKNARTIDENKRLLHALEELNDNLVLSESKVKDLQEELDATHVREQTLFPPCVN